MVYFHSRLEIAGHWSNIIIAMTGAARTRASERASTVESRAKRSPVSSVCDAPRERERDRVTLLLAPTDGTVAVSRFPAFEEVTRNGVSIVESYPGERIRSFACCELCNAVENHVESISR